MLDTTSTLAWQLRADNDTNPAADEIHDIRLGAVNGIICSILATVTLTSWVWLFFLASKKVKHLSVFVILSIATWVYLVQCILEIVRQVSFIAQPPLELSDTDTFAFNSSLVMLQVEIVSSTAVQDDYLPVAIIFFFVAIPILSDFTFLPRILAFFPRPIHSVRKRCLVIALPAIIKIPRIVVGLLFTINTYQKTRVDTSDINQLNRTLAFSTNYPQLNWILTILDETYSTVFLVSHLYRFRRKHTRSQPLLKAIQRLMIASLTSFVLPLMLLSTLVILQYQHTDPRTTIRLYVIAEWILISGTYASCIMPAIRAERRAKEDSRQTGVVTSHPSNPLSPGAASPVKQPRLVPRPAVRFTNNRFCESMVSSLGAIRAFPRPPAQELAFEMADPSSLVNSPSDEITFKYQHIRSKEQVSSFDAYDSPLGYSSSPRKMPSTVVSTITPAQSLRQASDPFMSNKEKAEAPGGAHQQPPVPRLAAALDNRAHVVDVEKAAQDQGSIRLQQAVHDGHRSADGVRSSPSRPQTDTTVQRSASYEYDRIMRRAGSHDVSKDDAPRTGSPTSVAAAASTPVASLGVSSSIPRPRTSSPQPRLTPSRSQLKLVIPDKDDRQTLSAVGESTEHARPSAGASTNLHYSPISVAMDSEMPFAGNFASSPTSVDAAQASIVAGEPLSLERMASSLPTSIEVGSDYYKINGASEIMASGRPQCLDEPTAVEQGSAVPVSRLHSFGDAAGHQRNNVGLHPSLDRERLVHPSSAATAQTLQDFLPSTSVSNGDGGGMMVPSRAGTPSVTSAGGTSSTARLRSLRSVSNSLGMPAVPGVKASRVAAGGSSTIVSSAPVSPASSNNNLAAHTRARWNKVAAKASSVAAATTTSISNKESEPDSSFGLNSIRIDMERTTSVDWSSSDGGHQDVDSPYPIATATTVASSASAQKMSDEVGGLSSCSTAIVAPRRDYRPRGGWRPFGLDPEAVNNQAQGH